MIAAWIGRGNQVRKRRCGDGVGWGRRWPGIAFGRGFDGLGLEGFDGFKVGNTDEEDALELGAIGGILCRISGLFEELQHEPQGLNGVFGSAQAQSIPPA